MKICLISSDERLYSLCREILAGLPGRQWELAFQAEGAPASPADIYVWEFDAERPIPAIRVSEEHRHIFLVDRKDLEQLRESLPMAAVSILLKPINPVTLQAFIEHAVARYENLAAPARTHELEPLRLERDAILQCLLEANLKLQEYDQDRTNFLARAVHDFRAPLTAVSGYCGLLLNQQLGPLSAEQSDVLQRMQQSLKRLTRMASAMFELSVGRRVEIRSNIQEGDIESCVDQALHEIMPFAQEKRIRVTAQVEPPPCPLYFDVSQMEQVMLNLLDNACKFTPKNGAVEVRGFPTFWERRTPEILTRQIDVERRTAAVRKNNAYRIEVSDSGPGIPEEQLDKVFEEYTSYSGSQDRSGGGLGLAICKMILNAHNGRIFAGANGSGATFVFLLPLGTPPELRAANFGGGAVRATVRPG